MAATTKLIVYNAVLRELQTAPLASLSETGTRLTELNGAWDHAVEHALSMRDWGFARRRSSLAGVSDTSFQPYIYRYTKPSDYLRKCWVKLAAGDAEQEDVAEIAAVFYGMVPNVLIEYISDHSDNYDPANWPPHFTRVVTLYLASLVSKLARVGAGDMGVLDGKMQAAMSDAEAQESVFLTNTAIPANRRPVMRRALEFIGQQLAGSVAIHSHSDMLRWHMNLAWDHALKYVLEQGAWNYATRRITMTGGSETVPGAISEDIIEGYSVGPATETTDSDLPDRAGFTYGYTLPSDFLHKIWIRADANHEFECHHQFMGASVFTGVEPVVMEYIAWDDDTTNPANWSATFLEAVAAYLALIVTPEILVNVGGKGGVRVSANEVRSKLEGLWLQRLSDAKLKDAIQQEPKTIPLGRYARARFGSIGTTGIRRYN